MNKFKSIYMFYDSVLSPVQHVCSYMIHSHYIATSVHIPNILKKKKSFFPPCRIIALKLQKQLHCMTHIGFVDVCYSALSHVHRSHVQQLNNLSQPEISKTIAGIV